MQDYTYQVTTLKSSDPYSTLCVGLISHVCVCVCVCLCLCVCVSVCVFVDARVTPVCVLVALWVGGSRRLCCVCGGVFVCVSVCLCVCLWTWVIDLCVYLQVC